jgi:hypothetical protein
MDEVSKRKKEHIKFLTNRKSEIFLRQKRMKLCIDSIKNIAEKKINK